VLTEEKKKMKHLFWFVLIMAGCASAQTVTFVNDSAGAGFNGHSMTLKVLDNGQAITKVKNHERVTVTVAPGVHNFAISFAKKDTLFLKAEAGKDYVVRVSAQQGFASASSTIKLVSGDEASYVLQNAKAAQ
jgi:hypothetical protein